MKKEGIKFMWGITNIDIRFTWNPLTKMTICNSKEYSYSEIIKFLPTLRPIVQRNLIPIISSIAYDEKEI